MLLLFTLTTVAVFTLGSTVLYVRESQRRLSGTPGGPRQALPARQQATALDEDRRLETLRLGDVVLEGDEDWLLVGTVHYQEEDERWFLHRMEGGRQQRWLYVRAMPDWQALWFDDVEDVASFGRLPDALTFRGHALDLWRRGDARLVVEGETEDRQAARAHYTVYAGRGGEMLVIEHTEAQRRTMAGHRILEGALTLMPGERPD